jgi:rod shape-determining protein MreC
MAIRTKTRSTRLLVVVLVSLSLATITVDYRQGEGGPLSGFGRDALAFMAPLQQAVSDATRPVGEFLSSIAEVPSLRRERDELRSQLEQARSELAKDQSLRQDYDELLAQTQLARSIDPSAVTALVIANSPSNFEQVITINKGANAGIKEGMPAIASAGLVGHVVRVSSDSAQIQLIIDRNSAVASRLPSAQETGVLVGQGDADLKMDLVDATAASQISSQDTVETASYRVPGGEGLYPPNIPIGTVSHVFLNPDGLTTNVSVRPAVDFSTLKFVSVVKTDGGG